MEASETFRESFGRRLRAARERAGFTADSLASALKVHRNTVYQLERGDQWISSELLEKIGDIFNVSPATLFTDDVVKIEPSPQEALEVLRQAIEAPTPIPEAQGFDDREMAMLREAAIAIREARSFSKPAKKRENHS